MTSITNGPMVKEAGRSSLSTLLDLLNQLETDGISYKLSHPREEAVMVEVVVPGERWEVEVFDDGHVEFERFRSDGRIGDASELAAELAKQAE